MRETRCQLADLGRVAVLLSASLLGSALPAVAQGGSAVQVFGPKQYVRTTGAPNQYTDTIAVPAWIVSPYALHVQNGDPSGSNRVSAATITINGTQVAAAPADFNQNVAALDRAVALTAQTTLRVVLDSKPGSYLIINLSGTNADHTAPVITFAAPRHGQAISTATPALELIYDDPVGAGEPAASGVDPTTLTVTLDGTDRTALFTRRSGDASATLPPELALAPGAHTLVATVRDLAGNAATATSRFTVDLTPPEIAIVEPAAGSYLATATPTLRVHYTDDRAIDLATLLVLVNGEDRTAQFTKTAADATLELTVATALPEGANQVSAEIRDTAGNLASASAAFNVDLTPPRISIGAPADGSRHGSPDIPIAISYSDDQALAPDTLRVRLDGELLAGLTVELDGATGTATGVAVGTHALTVRIRDRAGNLASASVSFLVDLTAPSIRVVAPAPGAFVQTASPALRLEYSDGDGVDLATLSVRLGAADVTHLFTVEGGSASADLAGALTIPDGEVTLAAQIRDLTGNLGTTESAFTVDTVAPVVSVVAPAGAVASGIPAANVTYADAGSGIDTASLRILLDGADVTGFFAVAAGEAVGTLHVEPPLADGPHTLQVSVADRAANQSAVEAPFLVDTTPPVAAFTAPPDDSFLNTPAPLLQLDYGDGTGSGVVLESVRIFLTRGEEAETEITSLFAVGAERATGRIPESSPLSDATYHLRATLEDVTGNPQTAEATFELDTVAPTYQIVQPAQSSALNTRTPEILVTYADDRSGVDPDRLILRLDSADRSGLLVRGPDQATATVPAEEGLADGAHTLEVTVEDRAGNTAPVVPQTFIVDTVPPSTVAAAAPPPNAAGWNDTDVTVTFTCEDPGSGVAVCPEPQTVAAEGAGQSVTGTAVDAAGNTASASVTVSLDKTPPAITAEVSPAPNAEGWNTTDVTVTFTCSDALSGVAECPAPVVVSAEGASQLVSGTATDLAGNTAAAQVTVNLSKSPPTITAAVSPAPNAAGWHNADATVTFTCTAGGAPLAGCPPPQVVSAEGADQLVSGTVTDAAGLSATATATVRLDRTPPLITATAAPAPNAEGWNTGDVTVTFTCTDVLSGVAECPPPVAVTAEGAGQVIEDTATDVAGNAASASVTIHLAKTPPTIAVALTPAPNAAGWNNSDVTVTFTCTPGAAPVVSCPEPQVVATEGVEQQVTGIARDAAGLTATATATVRLDKTQPAITQLVAPDRLAPGATGAVSVVVEDNLAIASVVLLVDGDAVATLTAPPFELAFTVPEGASAGDTLTVTVVVSDAAGNSVTASRGVSVAAQGVVVGQVLADATSLPLPGAVVEVAGSPLQDVSDAAGRYSIQVDGSHVFLRVAKPGMLPVEREVAVQPGVGTVAVDARLTAYASPVAIDSGGGTLSAGDVAVDVPPGGVAEPTAFRLTRLSAQGLPALLPLGWSPVAAFDLSAEGAAPGPFAATFSGVPANQPLQLVAYNTAAHVWTLVAPGLTSSDGTLAATLPAPGGYALVLADETEPPLAVPEAGQPLPGAEMVPLPPDAASSGALAPPSLSPAGGTALATLAVQSSVPLPSGTVLQAEVTELYTPSAGEPISEAARAIDIVLYRYQAPAGAALAAQFPVTPSRTFEVADLQSGKVHLDVLAGREGVRGQAGGSGAVVVQSGDASLAIAAGSLPQDTAISLASAPLASFLPAGNGLTPLAQYVLDFEGRVLGLPAQLSAGVGAAQPGDTLLLAQIQRFDGVPRLVVVALAEVVGDRIVSRPYPGLPGILRGSEYVFYRSADPVGFVAGLVSAGGGVVSALVQVDALPFVALADVAGRYTIPALPGTANVRAMIPRTALAGAGSVAVTAGQTAALDLALAGSVSAATVTPAAGALGVDPSVGITITAAEALNPATVTEVNVQLFEVGSSGDQPVAVRFVLSQGNRQVSVFPLVALQPSTRYRLQVSGLATAVGGLVAVPGVTFTTKAVTPPNFDPDALVFGFPDGEGNVAVRAPAGSFPPGSRVLIVDQTNGIVLSLTVGNDGSVSGELPATIDDVLQVTITAPDTSTLSFLRTQFVAPDGTVAVGANGGTVTGPGGVELRIPEGALNRAVRLKIEAFGPDRFPERPEVPSGHFGGGLKVSSPDNLALKKPLDLAFPKPADAPDGSFYYVYRRLATADGTVAFEIIDHAFVEGQGDQAKVVTASAPLPGFITGMGSLAANPATSVLASSLEENYFYLQWSYESFLVGVASQGLISGKVRRIVPPGPGQTDPTYVGIGGALVYLSDDDQLAGGGSQPGQIAVSQGDGTFSIWDRRLGGGTRKVKAVSGNETAEATAFEVNASEPDPVYFPNSQLYLYYRNVAKVNIAFPSLAPPPPAPQVDIRLFTLDAEGLRVAATGILQSGTSLVIAFDSPLTVKGVTVGGVPLTVTTPDVPDNPQDPLKLDSRVVGTYTVGPPGVYAVVATALPPLGGPAVTATRSFLAVAPGGDNGVPSPGAPEVIHTLPLENAASVATTTFPQVTFSEPVTQVPGNVMLVDSSGQAADLRLLGIRADGSVANPVTAGDVITALTLQPTTGLKFGETYTLTLGSDIVDQDEPPLPLDPFELHFTTFGPQILGETAPFSSTRPVILGQRAYVAKPAGIHSSLNIIDISDPAAPVEVGTPAFFTGRAADIAGVELSPVTQGPLVAVAAGVGSYPLPSNLWIYDVSNPDVPNRVAAVSATTSASQDGTLLRIAMKGGSIYASTFPKGIQVIDVQEAVAAYRDRDPATFGRRITTEGQGFATEAVVNTIPLTTGQGSIATMYDLEAGDLAAAPPDPTDPTAPVPIETHVVATGRLPLVVVNPLQSGPSAVLYPPRDSGGTGLSSAPLASADGSFRLEAGFTLALGTLQRTDAQGNSSSLPVAVVGGTGTVATPGGIAAGAPILAVVDMTDPRRPAPLGFLRLPELAIDIVLKDSVALVAGGGKVRLVSLADPARPSDAGVIEGSFGDRLAISDSGLLVTSSVNGTIGGIRTAALDVVAQITDVTPQINLDNTGRTTHPIEVEYQFVGNTETLVSGIVDVLENGEIIRSFPISDVSPGKHRITIPAGVHFDPSTKTVEVSVVRPDGTLTTPLVTRLDALDSDPLDTVDATTTALVSHAADEAEAPTSVHPFESLHPSSVTAGSGPVTFAASGVGLGSLTSVTLIDLDEDFVDLPVTSTSPDEVSFQIPGQFFLQAGFLRVSTSGGLRSSVLLPVADPGLPALGTAPDIQPAFMDTAQSDAAGRPLLSVYGANFEQGMRLVLGQGDLPTAALPTTRKADGSLQAVLPIWAQVPDDSVFVAVLSVDGLRLSNTLPLPVASPGDSAEPSQPLDVDFPLDAAAAFEPGDIEVTGFGRNPSSPAAEHEPLQQLLLEGVGLTEGATVQFKTVSRGAVVVENSTLTSVSDIGSTNASPAFDARQGSQKPPLRKGNVDVPPRTKKRNVRVARIRGVDADGHIVAESRPQGLSAGALYIPFGGRVRVGIYQIANDPNALALMTPQQHSTSPDKAKLMLRKDVTLTFQAQDAGRPLVQIEREPADIQAGYFRLRGVSLTRIPGETTDRPAAKLLGNGKHLRDAYVFYVNFGTTLDQNDQEIARAADRFGIPPNFLKAQAIRESDRFRGNFRYEPSTKDWNELTGDAGGSAINRPPFTFYAIGGRYLGNTPPKTDLPPFLYTTPNQTVFNLGVAPIKRRNGSVVFGDAGRNIESQVWKTPQRKELQPAVFARIEQAGKPSVELTLVRSQALWRKVGTKSGGFPNGVIEPAPDDLGPNEPPLKAGEFSVDYDRGVLTLGAPLQPGQSLRVTRFWPLNTAGRTVNPGLFIVPGVAPDLNSDEVKQYIEVKYEPAQSLTDWLTKNIADRPNGDFLSGTDSDRQIEFKVNGQTPVAPLDPKYGRVTAQPYAASSYGVLQLTLGAWTVRKRSVILDSIFNIRFPEKDNFRSIFDLLVAKDPDTDTTKDANGVDVALKNGLALGAAYTEASYNGAQTTNTLLCSPTNCTNALWQKQWAKLFSQYNPDEDFYKLDASDLNLLATEASKYVPR